RRDLCRRDVDRAREPVARLAAARAGRRHRPDARYPGARQPSRLPRVLSRRDRRGVAARGEGDYRPAAERTHRGPPQRLLRRARRARDRGGYLAVRSPCALRRDFVAEERAVHGTLGGSSAPRHARRRRLVRPARRALTARSSRLAAMRPGMALSRRPRAAPALETVSDHEQRVRLAAPDRPAASRVSTGEPPRALAAFITDQSSGMSSSERAGPHLSAAHTAFASLQIGSS